MSTNVQDTQDEAAQDEAAQHASIPEPTINVPIGPPKVAVLASVKALGVAVKPGLQWYETEWNKNWKKSAK